MVAPLYPAEKKRYTREDLYALYDLPENHDKRFELVNGVLIEVTPPRHIHSLIATILYEVLVIFVRQHHLGRVYGDGTGYDLPDGNSVIPDLSFVSASRLVPPEIEMDFAPDLVIEIQSPSNTPTEIRNKVRSYLASGARRVWVIYPDVREIDIHTLEEDSRISTQTLSIGNTLSGEDVLPGFAVRVSDIFPK